MYNIYAVFKLIQNFKMCRKMYFTISYNISQSMARVRKSCFMILHCSEVGITYIEYLETTYDCFRNVLRNPTAYSN